MLISIIIFCFLAVTGEAIARINVFVSILPQAYFVERVGGEHVDVEILVGEGHSPATYEPSPQQIAKLYSAKAYFAIGVPFENKLLSKIKLFQKTLPVFETQKSIPYRYFDDMRRDINRKDFHEDRSGMPDPHIWMDPKLVMIQARNIHYALCTLDPTNTNYYSRNLKTFLSDLERIDGRIRTALSPVKGRSMFVFHPAFGYFASSYGLYQVPIEIEGKEPSARQLAKIIDKARTEDVRVIFVQPQFSRKSAETIAKEIGGAVVPINPLAQDYLANLERIAIAVENSLR